MRVDSAVQISNATPRPIEKQLLSLVALHSTVQREVSGAPRGLFAPGRCDRARCSDHVVVVVPLDDVGRRQELLLYGRRRGRGRLHPRLEQVGHVEDLKGAEEVTGLV